MERKFSDEARSKDREIEELRSKHSDQDIRLSENIKILEEEIGIFKLKIQDHERRESELSSQYDKEQALWEGKYKFLEERNDNLK